MTSEASLAQQSSSSPRTALYIVLMVGIVLLPVTRNILGVKLSDVAFGLVMLLSLLWLPRAIQTTPLTRAFVYTSVLATLLFAFMLAATAAGYTKYGIILDKNGTIVLARFVLDWFLFLTVYCLAKRSEKIRDEIVSYLIVPAAALIVLTVPGLSSHFVSAGGDRFVGLEATGQPNTVAQLLAIAAALSWTRGLSAYFAKDLRRVRWNALWTFLLLYMVWLTQSRGVLLAIFISFPLGLLMAAAIHLDPARFRRWRLIVVGCIGGVVAAGTLAFQVIVPIIAAVLPRLLPATTSGGLPQNITVDTIIQSNLVGEVSTRAVSTEFYWPLVMHNPFGIGVSYMQKFLVYQPFLGFDEGPNTILDLPLVAGFGGVICTLLILSVVIRQTNHAIKYRGPAAINTVTVATALACQWTAAIVLGSQITNHYFWVLLALAVV